MAALKTEGWPTTMADGEKSFCYGHIAATAYKVAQKVNSDASFKQVNSGSSFFANCSGAVSKVVSAVAATAALTFATAY